MTESKESPIQPEDRKINPYLNQILNKALSTCYQEFSQTNKDELDKPEVREFLNNLKIIHDSIKADSGFGIRNQSRDKDGITHINLCLKENIDFSKTLPNGSFKLDIKPDSDPIKEVEISIRSFCEYKGHRPDPSRFLSQTGYEIDLSIKDIGLVKNDLNYSSRINFFPKKAGLGIRIYDDGHCYSFSKYYIGKEDFTAPKIALKKSKDTPIDQVSMYLSSVIPSSYRGQF